MPKGGYIIIDFKGIDLAGNNVKIDGIFRAVTNAYKKAVQITGIVIDGVEYPDAFVAIKSTLLEVYGYKIKIDSNDDVSATVINESSDLEKQIGTINPAGAKVTKIDNLIVISGAFYSTENITDEGAPVLFKMPAEYAPKTDKGFISHKVLAPELLNIGVKTNGDIILEHGTISNSTYYTLDYIYIKED